MHINEVENNQFFKFPKWLFDEPYINLKDRTKLMYMLLWDRLSLSKKNNWYDDDGRVYIYYTIEQLKGELKCSTQSVVIAKKELSDFGLIEEVRQGVNKPNKIYVYGLLKNRSQDFQNLDEGLLKNRSQDFQNIEGTKTEYIKTNISRLSEPEGVGETSYLDIGTPPPAQSSSSDFNLFDYYQERIGVIDGTQMRKLNDYINFDDMEVELVKRAIDKAADNGKRYFNYIESILKGWKQNGIKTVVQQDEEQRNWDGRKSSKNKNSYIDEDEAKRMQEKYGF